MKMKTGISGAIDTGVTLDIGDRRLAVVEVHCTLAHADRAGGEDGVYRYQKTAINEGVLLDPEEDEAIINLVVAKLNTAAGRVPIDFPPSPPTNGKAVKTDSSGVVMTELDLAAMAGALPDEQLPPEAARSVSASELAELGIPTGVFYAALRGACPESELAKLSDEARTYIESFRDVDDQADVDQEPAVAGAPDTVPDDHDDALFDLPATSPATSWWVFADGVLVNTLEDETEAQTAAEHAQGIWSPSGSVWVEVIPQPDGGDEASARGRLAKRWTWQHAPWFEDGRSPEDTVEGLAAIDPPIATWVCELLLELEQAREDGGRPYVVETLETWIWEDGTGRPVETVTAPVLEAPGEAANPTAPSSPGLTSGEEVPAPVESTPGESDTTASSPDDAERRVAELFPDGIRKPTSLEVNAAIDRALGDETFEEQRAFLDAVLAAERAADPKGKGRANVLLHLRSHGIDA